MMRQFTIWQKMIALFLTKWLHLRQEDETYSSLYDVAILITLQVMLKVPESGRFVECDKTTVYCVPSSKL
jgi:hypothetical protein